MEYESAFGPTRDFLSFVETNAIDSGHPIAETIASSLSALPKHLTAIKNFAGTAYFRTPGALSTMKKELKADSSPDAQKILGHD